MFGFTRKKDKALPPFTPESPDLSNTLAKPQQQGILSRLKQGMNKTSSQLTDGITGIFTKRKLDNDTLEALEELLILTDMGAVVAARCVAHIAKDRFEKDISIEHIQIVLAEELTTLLRPVQQPLIFNNTAKPTVIMVVGVNGNGKTTTIGKLAMRYKIEGKRVMLAAADTFRAAAVEQLVVWAKRADVPIITGAHEADPASVAHQAYEQARKEGMDVLLIDTAGRLQNKRNLMEELAKITRVLSKLEADSPHHILMVLDGTTGQNALSQVATFKEFVNITGVAITKLDGTAKGGMVVALAEKFGLPVHYIGIGEAADDLQDFDAHTFSQSLVGI